MTLLTGYTDSIPQRESYRAAVGLLQVYGFWSESLALLDRAFVTLDRDHQLWFLRWNALLWLIPGGCIIGAALYFSAKE